MTATEVCYPPIKEEHLPTDLPRELWGPRLSHPYRWYYKNLKTKAHYDGNVLQAIEVSELLDSSQYNVRRTLVFFELKDSWYAPHRKGHPLAFLPNYIKEAVEDALERVNIKKGTSYEMKDAISFIVHKFYVVF